MIDYSYHTHTYRCGHADGTEEEYVLAAIEAGYKVIGFTDHMFIENFIQKGIRGDFSELDDYVNTINNLKEKYKGKIEIRLGFECEFAPVLKNYYKFLLEEKGFDYLIIGQHLFLEEDYSYRWLMDHQDKYFALNKYVNWIIEGMSTGMFKYIAHPDLFVRMFPCFDEEIARQCERICEASLKYDIPLEINLGGIRGTRVFKPGRMNYANEEFFKIASRYGCKVIIGIDAHSPNDLTHFESLKKGEEFVTKFELNEIKRLDFTK